MKPVHVIGGGLAGSEAVATLVEHTMVGRLFPPALLAAHLDWAAQVASAVPVYRLSYPNGLEHLGALRQALADSLRPSSSAPHEQRAG
ncbi:MAG TPA: hypothetical protein PK413_05365 [Thermoanaerobaculia bacterium]|nr:hypothetical protein [Thermoanaerobaculia bacterium]